MSRNEITCELVDERDLDTRYLAGRLNPEEAEGFEAHFFGCERCWELVQQGLAVRIALGADAVAPQLPATASRQGKPGGRWWGLAAAAAVAAVVVGTWWTGQGSRPRTDGGCVPRGGYGIRGRGIDNQFGAPGSLAPVSKCRHLPGASLHSGWHPRRPAGARGYVDRAAERLDSPVTPSQRILGGAGPGPPPESDRTVGVNQGRGTRFHSVGVVLPGIGWRR